MNTSEWQNILDGAGDMFDGVLPGARLGLLGLGDGSTPLSRVKTDMLVWTRVETGMEAQCLPFDGFPVQDLDLLFAGDDDVLEGLAGDPFTRLVERVRDGLILLFYLKERDDLEELGYEDFFERLGLTFMGPCR